MNSKLDICEIIKKVRSELPELVSEKRLRHILAVCSLAQELARFFCKLGADIDAEKAVLAALLHDITKCMDSRQLCAELGIELSADDERSPETLHAVTGAWYAAEKYGVGEDIFSAVLKHTVGGTEMSLLDKIIFVSDYCEETRVHEECRRSRERLLEITAKASELPEKERLSWALMMLDFVYAEILGKTVKYLSGKGDFIHPQTVLSFRAVMEAYAGNDKFAELLKEYKEI